MTGKYRSPKEIEKLTDIYYNENNKNQLHQYESYLQNSLSPYCEDDAKRIFSCVGKIEKIPRSEQKTFDFEIKNKNVVFEITQIVMLTPSNPSVDQSSNIQKAIEHLGEKSSNADVIRGGMIYFSSIKAYLTNLYDQLQKKDFIISEMKKYNLSFILFMADQVTNTNPITDMSYPSLFYMNKKHKTIFDCIRLGTRSIEF